ncbi:hypothetical protein SI65_05578 [Aspergillus cristatus]|uniref:Uncharacterized protein n=1 Tax=Aspergillus cristatus TaxID=573508 RepID=A0A1E3BDX6_ASPCR|nr:hypothetical protein SI65_05578 [Aspergillus cristatus]
MFFPFIGLVVTLSLWSTILTLQPNDPRENYVRRLTSTIGITAVISGSLDLANGIINGYGSKQDGNAHTGIYDLVNGSSLHTTATSTVKISSKTAKSDSNMHAESSPLSTLIVVGGVLAMASLPRKNTISTDDSTLEGHHTELDQSSLEIACLLSPEAEPSLYDQMNFLLSSSLQLDRGSSETSTKPSQTPDSLGSVSQATSSTVSSVTSSPATSRSTTPAPSNVTTPDCTTPQASPVDYNHSPISQPVMPHCTEDDDLNCVEPDVTFHHQLELQANHDEGKASQRGPISDTITPTSNSTTSQLEQPLTPEQDPTATTPRKRRRPRPSQAKRRRFARRNEQALRLSASGQDGQVS